MTDHTYAGYTAAQIRAAAEAASPGTWREQRYMSDGKVGYGIVDGGRGLFIGEHRLMPFCETDRRHIVTSQPATVLALLDRIAELEQRVETVEGWHFTETSRADELQESIYGDRDEIAGLRARIAELEPDAARWSAIISGDLEGLTLFSHNDDWTTLDPLVGSTADAAIDAARAQPAE